jgi:TRAP-type mannitol/chloroaromatic compound transport system permease small subunit
MKALALFVRLTYGLNSLIGRIAAWLILVTVLVCAFVALSRYIVGFGRIWVQEIYVVAFGVSFMLIAPLAYAADAHVRVDILHRGWSPKRKAAIEVLGVFLFLIPWLLLVLWSSWSFVKLSWAVREPSPQAGGMHGFYLVKSVIPAFAILMMLQGLGIAARSLLVIAGRADLLPPEPEAKKPDEPPLPPK